MYLKDGWPDDSLLIFCCLFPAELNEEEAEDVLFKEVSYLFFEDFDVYPLKHYILGFSFMKL